MIYFIQADGTDRVKIGFTAGDPAKRLADLQTGCPHRLVILATASGSEQDEGRWHKDFATDRVQGEWFRLSPRLVAHIAAQIASSIVSESLCAMDDRIQDLKAEVRKLRAELAAAHKPAPADSPSTPISPDWWTQFIAWLAPQWPIGASLLKRVHCSDDGQIPQLTEDGVLWVYFREGHRDAADAMAKQRGRWASIASQYFKQALCLQIDVETPSGCENL